MHCDERGLIKSFAGETKEYLRKDFGYIVAALLKNHYETFSCRKFHIKKHKKIYVV